MEVLAAASSVAGLLSLAGQCVLGAQNLLDLYQDLSAASSTVETFIEDIDSLVSTLYHVQGLLEKIQDKGEELTDEIAPISLKLQLEDCDRAISSWLQIAQSYKPTGGKGSRAWFRKFWVAMDRGSVKNARADIQKTRTEILLALSMLGRAFDLQLALSTRHIGQEVHQTQTQSQAILENSTNANGTLARLETVSAAMSDDLGSMKSLMSSWSSASSRLSQPIPVTNANSSQQTNWRCDVWSSTGELFCDVSQLPYGTAVERCGFCGCPFLPEAEDSDCLVVREEHLKITHKLLHCCANPETFTELELFHNHLRAIRNAEMGSWTTTIDQACASPEEFAGSSFAYHALISAEHHLAQRTDSAYLGTEDPETEETESDMQTLMNSSWDANLLGEFISSRDRINRWMLHMLGSHSKHAELHRKICSDFTQETPESADRSWDRVVLKHWFIDDTATALDSGEAATGGGDEELRLINTSLYLSARVPQQVPCQF